MTNELLPIFIGLITAGAGLLGVFISQFWTYRTKKIELKHQSREENRKLKISRLEDLHERLLAFNPMITVNFTRMMETKKVINSEDLHAPETFPEMSYELAKIKSLLKIYAPELDEDMDAFNLAVSTFVYHSNLYLSRRDYDPAELQYLKHEAANKTITLQKHIQTKIHNMMST